MDTNDRASRILGSFIVTIDGPAGSGKSTTASLLAKRLGFACLDTGAMYRAVTAAVIRRGIDPNDGERAAEVARGLSLELRSVDGASAWFADGAPCGDAIRTPAVSAAVSPVSRHPAVRRAMVALQRSIGGRGGVVAEGRDTGTVVFPHAEVKIFLAADVPTRAHRRAEQLRGMGIEQGLEEIERNIRERDAMDAGREVSPLVRPPGATVIDTSTVSIDGQVDLAEAAVRREALRLVDLAVDPREGNVFARMSPRYGISHACVRGVLRTLFGLRIRGSDNLRFREGFIFASNHLSNADPLVVGGSIGREVYFLAKKELFRNPFFAALIRAYHAIPVDREELERKTLRLILEKLSNGASILMFPEGTRSKTGEIGRLKPGLGFTAVNSGVSVVPVYVTGSNRLGDCLLRRRPLEVRIGRPIRVPRGASTDDRKRDYLVLTDMVHESLRMLKDEASA